MPHPIFGDFFGFNGHHYLIAGDRLSGLTEIYKAPHGTPQAGSDDLMSALRSLYATFGIPEELLNDGGPKYIIQKTLDPLLIIITFSAIKWTCQSGCEKVQTSSNGECKCHRITE